MVVSWLIFIAVALLIDAGFVKLAARLLRYSVSWKVSFLFAGIMMVAVIFHHVLLFSAPVAIRIGLGVVLLLGLVIVGGWFFSGLLCEPSECSSWVVRRHWANGADVCFDDCGRVRHRCPSSDFFYQFSFRPLTAEEHHQRLSIRHAGKITILVGADYIACRAGASPAVACLATGAVALQLPGSLQRPIVTQNDMNPKVDGFFKKARKWREEFEKLRMVCLDYGLTEELKWGKPCYRYQESNIVLIHGFKEYCALLVFKGALLKDPKDILVQQTENVQATRQIRFTNVRQIVEMEPTLKAYIKEAIGVEKAGLEVSYKETSEFAIPEEFQNRLDESPVLKKAFRALTPGRQRGYLLYFSAAKQSKTREARIAKCEQQILKGKGLND